MFNPSQGRPAGMWNPSFDFSQPVNRAMSPIHDHKDFGPGYDLQYKDSLGRVQARLDGLRPDEAAFLSQKHGI